MDQETGRLDSVNSRGDNVVCQVLPDSSVDISRPDSEWTQRALASSSCCVGVMENAGGMSSSLTRTDAGHCDQGNGVTIQEHEQQQQQQQQRHTSNMHADGGSGLVEDILGGLESFADVSTASDMSHALSQVSDNQLTELNQLITELEHLQDSGVPTVEQANSTSQERIPLSVIRDDNVSNAQDVSRNDENVTTTSKVNDKVKSHPALAALLMSGGIELNEPFVPLKEKTFKLQPDVEGSVLYLKNAERKNIGLLSAASVIRMVKDDGRAVNQSAACSDKPNSSEVSTTSSLSVTDADNVINHLKQECGTTALRSSISEQSSRTERYWGMIEDKLRETIAQNQRLASLNVQLHAENYHLNKELGYHKMLLANQTAIVEAIRELSSSDRGTWTGTIKQNMAVPDEPGIPIKRLKPLELLDCDRFPPGGVCLYINPDSKVNQVQLCYKCTKITDQ